MSISTVTIAVRAHEPPSESDKRYAAVRTFLSMADTWRAAADRNANEGRTAAAEECYGRARYWYRVAEGAGWQPCFDLKEER